jgi:hypothetical protein
MDVLQNGQVGDGPSVSMRDTLALGWLLKSKRLLPERGLEAWFDACCPRWQGHLVEWVHLVPISSMWSVKDDPNGPDRC